MRIAILLGWGRQNIDNSATGDDPSGECNIYGDLRTKFEDLKEDKNLVYFIQTVLDRRD